MDRQSGHFYFGKNRTSVLCSDKRKGGLFFLRALAGAPIPDDLAGTLRTDLIDPEYLAAHPPEIVAAELVPGLARHEGESGSSVSPELIEKLRGLGYGT